MLRSLGKFRPEAYALLRIMAGWLFAFHGAQALFGILRADFPPDFKLEPGSQAWFGALIEFAGGLAVCLGFATRLAAFLCSGTMAVAYFQFHWRLQWDANFWPTINHGETAVLYCFIFLLIACDGAGKWALKKGD
jgi:putative oxidoreductase